MHPLRSLNRDERIKVALLSGWFFLTVTTLWMIKSVRVAVLLIHFGAKETPYVRLAGVAAVAVTVMFYSAAVNRLSRVGVVRATSAAFSVVLLGLWLTPRIGGASLGATRAFIWAIYILVDVYAVVMIELFWTYTNDVVRRDDANRLYGLIGLGGILGGVAGGSFVDVFTRAIGGSLNLLAVSAGMVLVCAALGSLTEHILRPPPRQRLPADTRADASMRGLREVRRSRYLLLLVGIVAAYEFTSTLADFGVNVVFEHTHLGEVELTRLYGRVGWIASTVAVFAQVVIVPLVLPTKRFALLLPPVAMLVCAVGVVIVPVLATVMVMTTVDRGLNYSVQQATREALYIPLTDAQKYNAKAVIDMFVDRAAKAVASLVVLVVIALAGESVRVALLVGCTSTLVWIGSARRLGSS